MINLRPLLLVALLLIPALRGADAPAPAPATPTLQGDAGRPAEAKWQRTELYFATGPVGGPGVTAAQWQEFLDAEVTPRFPDGLTVLDAYGQWRPSPAAAVERRPPRAALNRTGDARRWISLGRASIEPRLPIPCLILPTSALCAWQPGPWAAGSLSFT